MVETLAGIGEFGLIRRIRELLRKENPQTPGVMLDIGDDTAVFRPRPGYELLATCDCLVEGRHFLFDHIAPLDLGRRAMVVNISDIGAMGGHPLYALISLGLKPDTLVSDVEDMYRGFVRELKPFGGSIVGGNITNSMGPLFIDITLIGEAEQGKLMLRSSAQAGNSILVTGHPGQAAAGLRLLQSSQSAEDLRTHPLVQAFNTPSNRAKEGEAIAKSGYAQAMIDTSDGFLGDLGHICEESRVGAVLVQEKFPISEDLRRAAEELNLDPIELFLNESDDYELIISCSPENVSKVFSVIASVSNVPVNEVGRITDAVGDIRLIRPDGTKRRVIPVGWDHFVK